jgi:hypothetical protein
MELDICTFRARRWSRSKRMDKSLGSRQGIRLGCDSKVGRYYKIDTEVQKIAITLGLPFKDKTLLR